MALLKTYADESVMSVFLKRETIEPLIETYKPQLTKNFSTLESFTSEHIKLLSAQSYLVTYALEVKNEAGEIDSLILRGNRISPEAAKMWQYLYDESIKENSIVVPTPLEYFPEQNFMIYEEFPGKTLRDFDDKFESLTQVTPLIAKHIAWVHSLTPIESIGRHTKEDEKVYWDSVVNKINDHLPDKPDWLSTTLQDLHQRVISQMDTQIFTLCHNDFQASNIIFNEENGGIGIIDFGNSTVYSPSLDVATYLVHLSVMTTKHLTQNQIQTLQHLFLDAYFENSSEDLKKQVLHNLPLFIARTASDIIATTAVALGHTKNSYRILIPKILLPVVKEKIGLLDTSTITIEDCLITLKK